MPLEIIRDDFISPSVDALVLSDFSEPQQFSTCFRRKLEVSETINIDDKCYLDIYHVKNKIVNISNELMTYRLLIQINESTNIWSDTSEGEGLLRLVYQSILQIVSQNSCESLILPLALVSNSRLSIPQTIDVAKEELREYDKKGDLSIFLVLSEEQGRYIKTKEDYDVSEYIRVNYDQGAIIDQSDRPLDSQLRFNITRSAIKLESEKIAPFASIMEEDDLSEIPSESLAQRANISLRSGFKKSTLNPLDQIIQNLDEPFSFYLLRLIDSKGKTDVEVYKKANLDRKLFSKIRTTPNYVPSRKTALALAIGLELDLHEVNDLLSKAGYTLSHSNIVDVIIEYFIVNQRYDIHLINEVLFSYDQPLLGGS